MAMASRGEVNGKLKRSVKMDYSVTYRENDRLDMGLDYHITDLTKSAQRLLSDRSDELEMARADADKILKLKEAVNSQEQDSVAVICQSARRRSSAMSASNKRKASVAGSQASCDSRRGSVFSTPRDIPEGQQHNGDAVDLVSDVELAAPVKQMTRTERRLAMEREQFSAKNLFNGRRRKSLTNGLTESWKADAPPERQGSALSFASTTSAPPPQDTGRPRTSPAAFRRRGGGSAGRLQQQRGYLRPTTASASRIVSFAEQAGAGDEESCYQTPRRPRSRRELQRLSELKIDPFGEGAGEAVGGWVTGVDRRQDLLHSARAGGLELQTRVAAFLTRMEDFNHRGRKTGLEQILETT